MAKWALFLYRYDYVYDYIDQFMQLYLYFITGANMNNGESLQVGHNNDASVLRPRPVLKSFCYAVNLTTSHRPAVRQHAADRPCGGFHQFWLLIGPWSGILDSHWP